MGFQLRYGGRSARGRVLAFVVAGSAVLAVPAGSAAAGTPHPTPLWRAFPLEQTATTGGAATPRAPVVRRSPSASASIAEREGGGGGLPQVAFVLTIALCAMLVATTLVLRRKPISTAVSVEALVEGRRRAADVPTEPKPASAVSAGRRPRVVPEPDAPERGAGRPRRAAPTGKARPRAIQPAAPPPDGPPKREGARASGRPASPPQREAQGERAPTIRPAAPASKPAHARATARPALPSPRSAAAPRSVPAAARPPAVARQQESVSAKKRAKPAAGSRRASGGGRAEPSTPRAAAARGGPICQVRWLGRGHGLCFSAVTIDADGVERTLATSRRVEWRGLTPPDESPEAQAALRQLSKILRANGWRPMRAKGKDFNEERWYARRFRYVATEATADDTSAVASKRNPR